MAAGRLSLLSFLEAPVLVGDPEGRAAYVNPAFEARFGATAETVLGKPLAGLFDGGLREAMLRAVAEVCERGATSRFHLRHAGVGYAAVASPIVAEDARVGVVVVLVENSASDERLLALGRRIHQSCEELGAPLLQLAESLPAEAEGQRLVAAALRAHARLRGADQELQAALGGQGAQAGFELARLLLETAARVRAGDPGAGEQLELRLPERLGAVRGEPARLAAALAEALRERLRPEGARLLLAARLLEEPGLRYAVVSLRGGAPAGAEPAGLRRAVEELGGQLRSSVDPQRGPALAFRLPVRGRS